jgi:hypothetical protein
MLGFIPITIFFTYGVVTENLRVYCLPIPYLLVWVGLQFSIFTLLALFTGIKTPVRISSLPRGSKLRPPVYTVIEDIVAVDGAGGKAYRAALNERYKASPIFRRLIAEMSVFWGGGALIMGVVLIALLASPRVDPIVTFGLAWGAPWVWAVLWASLTFWWVMRRLRVELETWSVA